MTPAWSSAATAQRERRPSAEADLRAALPILTSVTPVASSDGRLTLRGTATLFGLSATVDATVSAQDGKLVVVPDVPFGGLATITVFSDPRIQVQGVSASPVPGGFHGARNRGAEIREAALVVGVRGHNRGCERSAEIDPARRVARWRPSPALVRRSCRPPHWRGAGAAVVSSRRGRAAGRRDITGDRRGRGFVLAG